MARVFIRDIAMFISVYGLAQAVTKYGTISKRRARSIIKAMKEAGIGEPLIPQELVDLAGTPKTQGKMTVPQPGEERQAKVTATGRVSANASVIGMKPGSTAKIRYSDDKIVITKPAAKRGG